MPTAEDSDVPTVWIKHKPEKEYGEILDRLAAEMPGIAAPQVNVSGRDLHDGGVGESEIMVEFLEFTPRDRNVNDIQITLIAHRFKKRRKRRDDATKAIKEGVMNVLRDFDRNVKVGVSIWLVDMGYETI